MLRAFFHVYHAIYTALMITLFLCTYKIVALIVIPSATLPSPNSNHSHRIAKSRSTASLQAIQRSFIVYNNSRIHTMSPANFFFNKSDSNLQSLITGQKTVCPSSSLTRNPSAKPYPVRTFLPTTSSITTKIPSKVSTISPTVAPTVQISQSVKPTSIPTPSIQPSKSLKTSLSTSKSIPHAHLGSVKSSSLQATIHGSSQAVIQLLALPSSFPAPTAKPSTVSPSQKRTLSPTDFIQPTVLPSTRPSVKTSTPSFKTVPLSPAPSTGAVPAMISSISPTSKLGGSISPRTAVPSTCYPTLNPSVISSTDPSSSPSCRPYTTVPSSTRSPTVVPSAVDDIQYRGGQVYTGSMKIFNIFYGDFSGIGSQTVSLTNYLAANLGTSAWYNVLTSYYQVVNGSKVYVSGQLTFAGSYNLFPTLRKVSTTIGAIQRDVIVNIFDKGITTPDPNTIYAIIFRGDFNVSSADGQWLQDWCGLHKRAYLAKDANFYPMLMVGDLSSVDPVGQYSCSLYQPYPNGNLAADSVANIYAHEVAEVITDPKAGQGWTFNPGPGRFPVPWECAEECEWTFPSSGYSSVGAKNYSLQLIWQPGFGCTSTKKGGAASFPTISPSILLKTSSPSTSSYPIMLPSQYPLVSPVPIDVIYHGGPVMTGTVNLYHIYFGYFPTYPDLVASQQTKNLMDYFATYFDTLPWFGVLSEYYQIENGVQTFAANTTRFIKSVSYQSTRRGGHVSDSDMTNSIVSLINSGKLPLDPNGIYVIMFRGDFIYDGLLRQWCSYHSLFSLIDGTILRMVVIGDPSTAPVDIQINCMAISPPTANGNIGADSMINLYAHEIANIITDPNGDAWYTDEVWHNEVGSQCSWNFGGYDTNSNTQIGGKSVLVQSIFQRRVGCVMFPASQSPTMAPSIEPSTILRTKQPSVSPTRNLFSGPTVLSSSAPSVSLASRSPSRSPSTVPSGIPGDVVYYGGPVMTGPVNLYHIYFGKFNSQKSIAMKNLMDYFGQYFTTLPWFGMLSEYFEMDYNKRIKSFAANSTRFIKSVSYSQTSWAIDVDDDDMTESIRSLIRNDQLRADPNGIYIIIFRGDLRYNGWLDNWCAKHDSFSINDVTLKYAVVGDPATATDEWNKCSANSFPNQNCGADSMFTYYAHEIAEVITDPYGDAWNFGRMSNGDIIEIADKCEESVLDTARIGDKTVLVQQIFQRGVGCVKSGSSAVRAAESVATQRAPLLQQTPYPVRLPTIAPNRNFDISYHAGGAVMTGGVTLVNIFLGNFSSQSVGLVTYFSAHIGGSSWYDVLTSYYQLDGAGQQSFVSRDVSFDNSSTAMLMSTTRAAVLTDGDIQQAILRVIITSPDAAVLIPNAIYTVMFRGDFNVSYGGKYWLEDWCSYHATMTLPGGYVVRYAVIGDPSTVARGQDGAVCEPIYGIGGQPPAGSSSAGTQSKGRSARVTANGNLGGDSMLVSYAQQLANIVTDFQGAWYSDQDGSEAGSACWRRGGAVAASSSWNIQLKDKRFLVPSLWQPGRGCTLVKL